MTSQAFDLWLGRAFVSQCYRISAALRAACLSCLLAGAVLAQETKEQILPLDAHIDATGKLIELNWFDANPPRVGSVSVKRRLYGQTGGASWQTLAQGLGPVMRYTDNTIEPGIAYEYQVIRTGRDIVDVGYWVGGTEIPAQDRRGTVHLVVDETVFPDISRRMLRFELNLVGDGWRVRRYGAPRGETPGSLANVQKAQRIKNVLRTQYAADPFARHVVILIGHIPLTLSGSANPDGHSPVPHPTDLFYAEMDGQWRASPEGVLLHNQVPSDFIEMQVGRIDFSRLSGGDREREIHLLRAYFDKNHHWRMQYHGDLRNAYGQSSHLRVEQVGLRNIVGATSITSGGHHDAGEEKSWLWGVDFGHYNGGLYAEDYANKAVFTVNFGSGKQRIEQNNNALTALLAQPWYTIATGWGGRPAWWLHHMALGGTIGDTHLRTVNNGGASQPYRESMDYFPPGRYMFRNAVWVNLLGDPTTHTFPMAPPSKLRTEQTDQGVVLSWQVSPDPDVIGYKVYRAAAGSSDFAAISEDILTTPSFTDTTPGENPRYMVRAYGLKRVYAGSFFTLSQGAFSDQNPFLDTVVPLDIAFTAPAQQPVILPEMFQAAYKGPIYAFIRQPNIGRLSYEGANWIYTPPTGFKGTVQVPFSVSTGLQTQQGSLTMTITEPSP